MIRFDHLTFSYGDAREPVLRDVDLRIAEGELCLVVGPTGSGKSTLLRAVNGLVPHFSGGLMSGDVRVAGRSTRDHRPRELADLVGMVSQDPQAGFVTDVVEDELVYAMENLGVSPDAMRRRVEDTIDLLGLVEVRRRSLDTLSAGQMQRVAIGAVLTASPRVLVLDEPTSALDPAAADEVLAALTRLVHDLGMTVLLAEHRLERVVHYADRIVELHAAGGGMRVGPPSDVMASCEVAPPVVRLGRVFGWDPIPLSVRDARRSAVETDAVNELAILPSACVERSLPEGIESAPVARLDGVTAGYDGGITALKEVDLVLRAGEVTAVMGRNGAGKSTLLSVLAGLRPAAAGRVRVEGRDPHRLAARDVVRSVGLVPQDPGLLLYGDTVGEECEMADREGGLAPGTTRATAKSLIPDLPCDVHPRDLSEGQRLGLALAIVLAPRPPVVLLDEPTRGLDYPAKARLVGHLRSLAGDRHAVVVATHDVEFVAEVADRAVVLAAGEMVAEGPAREVVCHSPVFAPQVAKILAPRQWLTVGEVEAAMLKGLP